MCPGTNSNWMKQTEKKLRLEVAANFKKYSSWNKKRPLILKGQLISKCPFGVFKSPKKQQKFSRISALASKKRLNQKSSLRESK